MATTANKVESAAMVTIAKIDADIEANGHEVVSRELIQPADRHGAETYAARFQVRVQGVAVRINVQPDGKVRQSRV